MPSYNRLATPTEQQQAQIQRAIARYLAANEPATLPEILDEVRLQVGISHNDVLPPVMAALVAMAKAGKICEYEQAPLNDPLEYAWVRSND